MSTPQGWSSQEKDERIKPEFSTVQPVGEKRHGLEVHANFYHKLVTAGLAIVSVTADKNGGVIQLEITGHGARKGDLIYFRSGLSADRQIKVYEVIDNDNILLAETITSQLPVATDTVDLMRPTQPRVNDTGDIIVSPGDISFQLDGASQVVTEDTVTPANNAPLPVKLTSTTGDINITAGDLNVQTSHVGPSFDSMRIGDGTVLFSAGQKASAASFPVVLSSEQQALIDGIETSLSSIDGKLPATLGQQNSVDSLAVVLSNEQQALIDGIEALLTTIDADTGAISTNTATIAGDTTSIDGKLPATLGQKASATSLAVVLSTEQQALITSLESLLTAIDTDTGVIAGDTTSIDGKLTVGQQANAASLAVVLSTEQEGLLTTIDADTGSISTNTGTIAGDTTSLDGKVSLGSQLSANSIAVVLSSEQEAMIDGLEGLLATIDADTGNIATSTSNIDGKLPASLGPKTSTASLSVTLSSDEAPIDVDSSLTPVDFLDSGVVDASSTNIPSASNLAVVASLASAAKKIQIVEDIGEFMTLRTGAGAILAYLPLGGGDVEIDIPAATALGLRSESGADITTGKIAINFLG